MPISFVSAEVVRGWRFDVEQTGVLSCVTPGVVVTSSGVAPEVVVTSHVRLVSQLGKDEEVPGSPSVWPVAVSHTNQGFALSCRKIGR